MALFDQMQPAEQAHSIGVFRKLREAGFTNRDLLIAALLHDVGKIKVPLRLWERVEVVIFKKIVPGFADTWGKAALKGWQKPFVVALRHPSWGAELAEQAGASQLTVSLIKRHQDKLVSPVDFSTYSEEHFLYQLQFFDNES